MGQEAFCIIKYDRYTRRRVQPFRIDAALTGTLGTEVTPGKPPALSTEITPGKAPVLGQEASYTAKRTSNNRCSTEEYYKRSFS